MTVGHEPGHFGPQLSPETTQLTTGRRAPSLTRSKMIQRVHGHGFAYLLLAPLLLVLLVVLAYPLAETFRLSVLDVGIIGSPSRFVGLRTFAHVAQDPEFWAAVRRSVYWLLGNMVIQTVFSFTVALLMSRGGWLADKARILVMFPWVIPSVAVAIIWQWMLNSDHGVIVHLLTTFHIMSSPSSPFAHPQAALPVLIFINSWHWFPLGTIIIFGAIQTIPEEIIEAARVDGAGDWRMFWSITLPLISPAMFALGLVGTLWGFNVFDTIYIITKGGPSDASTTAPVYVFNQAFQAFQASQAAAASVLILILLSVFAILYIRFARPKSMM